jgi:hypothetical protein
VACSRPAHYGVYLARAAGRVGFAAQQARRLYQKFEPVDVTQVMRDDSIVSVILEADLPARRNVVHEVLSPVQNIVLRTKGADTALQPSALAVTPIEWGNGALPHFPPIRYTAAMLTNS